MHYLDSTIFLLKGKDQTVVFALGWFDHSKFEPFNNVMVYMSIGNLEMLHKSKHTHANKPLLALGKICLH